MVLLSNHWLLTSFLFSVSTVTSVKTLHGGFSRVKLSWLERNVTVIFGSLPGGLLMRVPLHSRLQSSQLIQPTASSQRCIAQLPIFSRFHLGCHCHTLLYQAAPCRCPQSHTRNWLRSSRSQDPHQPLLLLIVFLTPSSRNVPPFNLLF